MYSGESQQFLCLAGYMNTLFNILQATDEDPSRQKKVDLVQIMVVIGSGILSSTTIATVVKAWLESRKTRLTIQIDGETKKLEYEGLYLSQEVSTIQALLETLGEEGVHLANHFLSQNGED